MVVLHRFYCILKSEQTGIQQQVRIVHVQDCIAIIGLENQFLVFLRVAVLDRFFTYKQTNPSISMTKISPFSTPVHVGAILKVASFYEKIIELYHGYHVCRLSERTLQKLNLTLLNIHDFKILTVLCS